MSSSINIALAQRLLRKLCQFCKKEIVLEGETKKKIDEILNSIVDKTEIPKITDKVCVAVGCEKCNNTGYKGRIGIYEGIKLNPSINEAINNNSSEEAKLKKQAMKNIQFVGKVSDEERVSLLARAKALICAASDEDFGITAIEAQAAGTPVIALDQGGYKETIIADKTGIFFEELQVESLQSAINKFETTSIKIEDLKKNAAKFAKENFKKQILDLIEKI
jgi:glycosyltransferase involved in cell wall biosynthesis